MSGKYTIPTMRAINQIKKNGCKAISLFSGCGGSSLGYRMAGYEVLYANEFVETARNCYRLNNKKTYIDDRDIRTVTGKDILKICKLKKGELDLLDGSPPCSSFSLAGVREKAWGQEKTYSNTKQQTDDLFFEYARILKDIQPKVFVAENVKGLMIGKAKGYLKLILEELQNTGYKVEARLLNSAYLDVAQKRERIIFVGVRKDLGKLPCFPKPQKKIYNVIDVLKSLKKNNINLSHHLNKQTAPKTYKSWSNIEAGRKFSDYTEKRGKITGFSHIKINPYATLNTTTTSASIYHWTEPRTLSIDELKQCSGFPEDFLLEGSFVQQWERIARAVPPVMMKHIASAVYKGILK
jgi:DNA (cytosine-5)-methyltransferase 1